MEKSPKDIVWRRYDVTDGPNHATSPRRHHSGHGNNSRLIASVLMPKS